MATFVSMATCHACNTTSRHKGVNRDFLASLAKSHSGGTPGSASKHSRTPQSAGSRSGSRSGSASTPKTPGKNKTPSHTPRGSTSSTASASSVSSSSSSSKTPKPKNWVVQRLSKILMRDDSPTAKKGGLKDFLSSL